MTQVTLWPASCFVIVDSQKMQIGGRNFLLWLAVIVSCFVVSSCAPSIDQSLSQKKDRDENKSLQFESLLEISTKHVSFETDEGTWMGVDISPDGGTIVFDLLGDLYILPISGGVATAITSGAPWDQSARFSLDGEYVYFTSDRVGFRNVWSIRLSDRKLAQVTRSSLDILGDLNWTTDGTTLLAGVFDGQEIVLNSINTTNGKMLPLEDRLEPFTSINTRGRLRQRIMVYSGVGSLTDRVYFSEALNPYSGRKYSGERSASVQIHELDPRSKQRRTVTPNDAPYDDFKPQLSADGNLLVYFRQYLNGQTEIREHNLVNKTDRTVLRLDDSSDPAYSQRDDSRPNYAISRDAQFIIFWNEGKIHRLDLSTGNTKIIPFRVRANIEVLDRARPRKVNFDDLNTARAIRWSSFSPNSDTMVFTAIGYVWLRNTKTGELTRLTETTDFEYMPSISPDGSSIAYVGYTASEGEYGPARLMVADLSSGRTEVIYSDADSTILLPNWSADGTKIALVRDTVTERGPISEFGYISLVEGEFRSVAKTKLFSKPNTNNVYSRFVGFNEQSDRLVYSYPKSEIETVLLETHLNGRKTSTIAVGGPDIGGIVPTADLKRVAVTRHNGSVWVGDLNSGDSEMRFTMPAPGFSKVSNAGGLFADWHNKNELIFSLGPTVFRYQVKEKRLFSETIAAPLVRPKNERPLVFDGARLITVAGEVGNGAVIETGTLVVEHGRITDLGEKGTVNIPQNAIVFDATNKTIMPGLIDSHYHGMAGPASAFVLPNPNFEDRSAIAYGVTSAWGAGGRPGAPTASDLQAAGRIVGPRWFYAESGAVGYPWGDLFDDFGDAVSAIDRFRAVGVDVAKEYTTPTRQQRRWISRAAYAGDMGVVSHLESYYFFTTRIFDGYTGGDHPEVPTPLYKDVETLLNQTGFIWTPNALFASGMRGSNPADAEAYFLSELQEKRPDEFDKFWYVTGRQMKVVPASIPYEQHRVSRVAKSVAEMSNSGAKIAVSAHHMPAFLIHREMWQLWKGGMPIPEVLRAATMTNAEKLGLQDEIGSLEVGKVADFLVLDENPLDDILNTMSIHYTVQGGIVFDPDTIRENHRNTTERGSAIQPRLPLRRANLRPSFSSISFMGRYHICPIHPEGNGFLDPYRNFDRAPYGGELTKRVHPIDRSRLLSKGSYLTFAPRSFSSTTSPRELPVPVENKEKTDFELSASTTSFD